MEGHFREYVRASFWHIASRISEDGQQWFEVAVPNISAGGLLFLTDRSYKTGDTLWIELDITPCMHAPHDRIKKIKIIITDEREPEDHLNSYAATFVEMSFDHRIRLDEMVRLALVKYQL